MQIHEFEPKVIKNARKAIQEKIKLLEEERIMFDYEKQHKQIVTGKIRKVDYNGYTVDIGYADALLPVEEQVEDEYYKVGDLVRAYVLNIRKLKGGREGYPSPAPIPNLSKSCFESEIPEVFLRRDRAAQDRPRTGYSAPRFASSPKTRTSTPRGAAWGPRASASSRYARNSTASRSTSSCGTNRPSSSSPTRSATTSSSASISRIGENSPA